MIPRRSPLGSAYVAFGSVALGLLAAAAPAAAHTDSDVVAVPAGAEAEVVLKPTHGCGDSPTVAVSTRVPVAGATGDEVEGWTVTAADDGEGRTVIDWTGGTLPADQTGEFPVAFVAPDTPGALLTFPFIQTCENGEELAWIQGDPAGEFPAPRLLVLPAGAAPAASIDDVPADAPGRELLVEVVDVDNPAAEATTTTTLAEEPSTTAAPAGSETSAPLATAPEDDLAAGAGDGGESEGDGGSALSIVVGVLVLAAVVGAVAWQRSRSRPT